MARPAVQSSLMPKPIRLLRRYSLPPPDIVRDASRGGGRAVGWRRSNRTIVCWGVLESWQVCVCARARYFWSGAAAIPKVASVRRDLIACKGSLFLL